MAEVCRMYVPHDDLNKKSYLRELLIPRWLTVTMVDSENPEIDFELVSVITI